MNDDKLMMMPKVLILFAITVLLLFSPMITNTQAEIPSFPVDLKDDDHTKRDRGVTPSMFTTDIVRVDPDFFTKNDFKRYLIFGTVSSTTTDPQKTDRLKNNAVYGIESDHGFFLVSLLSETMASNLVSQGYTVIEDTRLDYHAATTADPQIPDASRIGNITGSDMARTAYNSTGNGTVIAVVDTGVDFSNPDIQHSLARDKLNHPIMLDPDGQGIILTNATFFAYIDEDQTIRNYSKPTPPNTISSAYVTHEGVFLDVSQGGKGSDIPIYNSFFPQFGSTVIFNGTLDTDIKIGNDNRNFIKSKSGLYRVGIIYQGTTTGELASVQVVPVLVVDSYTAGVYDTIIPDMSTSWKDYTRFDLKPGEEPEYDFDFTDEKPIVLGSGNEFLVYDSDGDGKNDYSAGTVGAQVLDLYGIIKSNSTADISDTLNAVNGTLLPALDTDGRFFGVMTDFVGHGTSSAGTITSRGTETYDIYNNTKRYTITGVAPDAKIIPVKALWFGDTVYAWLWSAGFENQDRHWRFSGETRADIISNSWGISNFPSFNASPGMDVLSLVLGVLTTPQSLHDDYPGITIVSSAGNSGHGYGTIGMPNASPFGISVGATTNNVYVGYGPFKDQPRFGNTTAHFNHVVDFSSRGPSSIGDPKPDVMSIGAHGFTPSNVLRIHKDSKEEAFTLFGGTSMAAPVVSGSAAVLIEELKKQSVDYNPYTIKNILMSTATDLHNDALTQGSGLADVKSALDFVNGKNGTFVVYNDDSYLNIKDILEPAIKKINSTSIGLERFKLPAQPFPMTSWFAGQLHPGERTTTSFTIENPTNETLSVSVRPEILSLISSKQFNGTTVVQQQDPAINKSGVFVPNYIRLAEFGNQADLLTFFGDDADAIPVESSLMILHMNFKFDDFMNATSDIYADDLKISSLYLYDWLDNNNDTKITSSELSLVNRAGSWGTTQEMRISQPNTRFEGVPLVGVYPVPARYSYWFGETVQNSTAMDYTVTASYYEKKRWPLIWTESDTVNVLPKDSSTVDVTLVVPPDSDIQTGVYQGFLNFKGKQHVANAPVSFVVKQPVAENDSAVLIKGVHSDDVVYGTGYTKGAFDMINRYMAGDWRQYYFDIQNEDINTAAVEISWVGNNTNMSVFVMNPSGEIIQTNVPSGVFGHFQGWVSLDWLGNSAFSQGGGFYPVKNKDDTSTVLYVPINQTGTYTLLTHTTLYDGASATEPVTVAAKFTNISSEMMMMVQKEKESDKLSVNNNNTDNYQTESAQADSSDDNTTTQADHNDTNTTAQTDLTTPSKQPQLQQNDTTLSPSSDMSFTIGITVGIAIGTAITIAFVLIIRQKPPK